MQGLRTAAKAATTSKFRAPVWRRMVMAGQGNFARRQQRSHAQVAPGSLAPPLTSSNLWSDSRVKLRFMGRKCVYDHASPPASSNGRHRHDVPRQCNTGAGPAGGQIGQMHL